MPPGGFIRMARIARGMFTYPSVAVTTPTISSGHNQDSFRRTCFTAAAGSMKMFSMPDSCSPKPAASSGAGTGLSDIQSPFAAFLLNVLPTEWNWNP